MWKLWWKSSSSQTKKQQQTLEIKPTKQNKKPKKSTNWWTF